MFRINAGDGRGRLDLKLAGAESGYGFAYQVHRLYRPTRATGPNTPKRPFGACRSGLVVDPTQRPHSPRAFAPMRP